MLHHKKYSKFLCEIGVLLVFHLYLQLQEVITDQEKKKTLLAARSSFLGMCETYGREVELSIIFLSVILIFVLSWLAMKNVAGLWMKIKTIRDNRRKTKEDKIIKRVVAERVPVAEEVQPPPPASVKPKVCRGCPAERSRVEEGESSSYRFHMPDYMSSLSNPMFNPFGPGHFYQQAAQEMARDLTREQRGQKKLKAPRLEPADGTLTRASIALQRVEEDEQADE